MPLALDGQANGTSLNAGSVSCSLTTANAGDLIYVAVYLQESFSSVQSGNPCPSVLSVTSPHVTFIRRAAPPSANLVTLSGSLYSYTATELWIGVAAAALSSEAIKAQFSATDNGRAWIIAVGVSGVAANPLDSNASLAVASAPSGNAVPSATISTSESDDFIFWAAGSPYALGNGQPPSGFTAIYNNLGSGPSLSASYKIVSAAQSGITLAAASGFNSPAAGSAVCDAATADAGGIALPAPPFWPRHPYTATGLAAAGDGANIDDPSPWPQWYPIKVRGFATTARPPAPPPPALPFAALFGLGPVAGAPLSTIVFGALPAPGPGFWALRRRIAAEEGDEAPGLLRRLRFAALPAPPYRRRLLLLDDGAEAQAWRPRRHAFLSAPIFFPRRRGVFVEDAKADDWQPPRRFFVPPPRLVPKSRRLLLGEGQDEIWLTQAQASFSPPSTQGVLVLPGWPVKKSARFAGRVQRAVTGRELRALDQAYPIWEWTLTYPILRDSHDGRGAAAANPRRQLGRLYQDDAEPWLVDDSELRTMLSFYLAQQGALGAFLYDDPTDDKVTGQIIGTGDGATESFQLVRTMGGFDELVTTPSEVTAVYVDDVPVGFYADLATGLVTIMPAPPEGASLTADFSYFFPVRWSDDTQDYENFLFDLWELRQVKLQSVPAGRRVPSRMRPGRRRLLLQEAQPEDWAVIGGFVTPIPISTGSLNQPLACNSAWNPLFFRGYAYGRITEVEEASFAAVSLGDSGGGTNSGTTLDCKAGDYILVAVQTGSTLGAGTPVAVTGVTSTSGIEFTKLAGGSFTNAWPMGIDLEYWGGFAASDLSGEIITANWGTSVAGIMANIVATAIGGCAGTNDPLVSPPAFDAGISTAPQVTIDTALPFSILAWAAGGQSIDNNEQPPAGFVPIGPVNQTSVNQFGLVIVLNTSFRIVGNFQSGLTLVSADPVAEGSCLFGGIAGGHLMALQLSTILRNAMLASWTAAFGAGGQLRLFDGALPANVGLADAGTKLLQWNLATTPWNTPTQGIVTLAGTPLSASSSASGTARYFRLYDHLGGCQAQGSCGGLGSGADLDLLDTAIAASTVYPLNGLLLRAPGGPTSPGTLQFATGFRNALLDDIGGTLGGSEALRLWSGSPPADCEAADTGILLAEFDLAASGDWNAASGGVVTLAGVPLSSFARLAGLAGHFRLYDASDTCHMQGTVASAGADLIFDNATFVVNQPVIIAGFTLTALGA